MEESLYAEWRAANSKTGYIGHMVATDGHRLALPRPIQTRGTEWRSESAYSKKAMDEVEKLSSAAGSDAHIELRKVKAISSLSGPSLADFTNSHWQFPNYEAVLPRDNINKSVVIEARRTERRRCAAFRGLPTSVRTPSSWLFRKKASRSPPQARIGEAKEEYREGNTKAIPSPSAFNSSYMLDFLRLRPMDPSVLS
jgi:DNA polymerase III sliding clamp (beta) subunit (PCNA family)